MKLLTLLLDQKRKSFYVRYSPELDDTAQPISNVITLILFRMRLVMAALHTTSLTKD